MNPSQFSSAMTASTQNQPTNFLFVNKDAASTKLSKSEGDVTSAIFRHVQEHIRSEKAVKHPQRIKHKSLKKSKYLANTGPFEQATARPNEVNMGQILFLPQNKDNDKESGPSSRGHQADQTSGETSEASSSGVNNGQITEWQGDQSGPQILGDLAREVVLSLPGSLFLENKAVDPFDSVPVRITANIHQLLIFFESMFFSHTATQPSSSNYLSASRNVIKDCIFDEVQLKCLLASLASRKEIFDHQRISGGATWYIQQAVIALQNRLKHSSTIDHKLMYAMMKLYVAEAYQSNAEAALTHLRGAQTACNQIGTWHNFDTSYTPTICASGEAFFLQRVWKTPTIFPTLADPGSARTCFSPDLIQEYLLESRPPDNAAQKLLSELSDCPDLFGTIMTLQEIIADIMEFSTIRQTVLMHEHLGFPIPVIVSQWSHLRRFALVFRLMSVPITKNDFLHAIRVSLVLWLQMVANYSGFDQSLKIVARHLRDVVEQAMLSEKVGSSDAMIWICLIGASIGDQDTRKWFVDQLSRLSVVFDPTCSMAMDELRKFLVDISQGCLYCDILQRQSNLDIARDVFLVRLQQQALV